MTEILLDICLLEFNNEKRLDINIMHTFHKNA